MRSLTLTILVTAVLALTAWQVAKARESSAGFRIVVQNTDNGIALKCTQGCAWKAATWTCDAQRPLHNATAVVQNDSQKTYALRITDCRFGVDERGVGPAPDDP
jgi:hypothetical protein